MSAVWANFLELYRFDVCDRPERCVSWKKVVGQNPNTVQIRYENGTNTVQIRNKYSEMVYRIVRYISTWTYIVSAVCIYVDSEEVWNFKIWYWQLCTINVPDVQWPTTLHLHFNSPVFNTSTENLVVWILQNWLKIKSIFNWWMWCGQPNSLHDLVYSFFKLIFFRLEFKKNFQN